MKRTVLTLSRLVLLTSLVMASACSGVTGAVSHNSMWDKAFAQSMVPAKPIGTAH